MQFDSDEDEADVINRIQQKLLKSEQKQSLDSKSYFESKPTKSK